jgi:hypothetical protein
MGAIPAREFLEAKHWRNAPIQHWLVHGPLFLQSVDICGDFLLTASVAAPEDLERLAEEKLTQGGWSVFAEPPQPSRI